MVNQPVFGCPVVSVYMPWVLLFNSACSLYITVMCSPFGAGWCLFLYFSITLETLLYVICVSACVVHVNYNTGREVRAQLLGVGSPFPVWFCEPWGWDSSHQAVVASAVPSKSSCLSSFVFLDAMSNPFSDFPHCKMREGHLFLPCVLLLSF